LHWLNHPSSGDLDIQWLRSLDAKVMLWMVQRVVLLGKPIFFLSPVIPIKWLVVTRKTMACSWEVWGQWPTGPPVKSGGVPLSFLRTHTHTRTHGTFCWLKCASLINLCTSHSSPLGSCCAVCPISFCFCVRAQCEVLLFLFELSCDENVALCEGKAAIIPSSL